MVRCKAEAKAGWLSYRAGSGHHLSFLFLAAECRHMPNQFLGLIYLPAIPLSVEHLFPPSPLNRYIQYSQYIPTVISGLAATTTIQPRSRHITPPRPFSLPFFLPFSLPFFHPSIPLPFHPPFHPSFHSRTNTPSLAASPAPITANPPPPHEVTPPPPHPCDGHTPAPPAPKARHGRPRICRHIPPSQSQRWLPKPPGLRTRGGGGGEAGASRWRERAASLDWRREMS